MVEKLKIWLVAIAIGFSVSNVWADFTQEIYSNIRFKSFSTQEGLSQSSVLSLVQDAQGFIWMGTKDGLNRFDGFSFITYKHNIEDQATISNNEIVVLKIDSEDNLLIGTRGGGFNKFLKNENKFLRYPELNITDGTVNTLLPLADGTLYIGTSQGLYRAIPKKEKAHQYEFINLSKDAKYYNQREMIVPSKGTLLGMVCIQPLSKNKYVVGAEEGLYLYDKEANSFTFIDLGKLNSSKVNSLAWDKSNYLWVATSEGMAKLKFANDQLVQKIYLSDNAEWERLKINWVEQVIGDADGNIWAGTRGAGLVFINPKGDITDYYNDDAFSNKIGDNIINSLLIDRTGVLWIGTESRGVVNLDLFRKRFNHLENLTQTGINLTNNLVTAITGDENEIWIGTAYNGLDNIRFTRNNTLETRHFGEIPCETGKSSTEIISLLLDKDKVLWIGTASNNLTSYTPDKGFKYFYTGGFAFALHEDRQQTLWIGTWGKGLGKLNKTDNSITYLTNNPNNPKSLSGNIILSVFDDSRGNLWVGTKGSGLNVTPLNQLKQGVENFISFRHDSLGSLCHNDINCIFQDSEDIIWIGTGGGLIKLDLYTNPASIADLWKGKANFITYTMKDGLPANLIYGIKEDAAGNIWVSTIKGLSRLNKKDNSFKNFNANDGLQSNEFHANASFATRDRLFFGGVNGLSFFKPSEIENNKSLSQVVISALKISNQLVLPNQKIKGSTVLKKDISVTDKIKLNRRHDEFTLEFSALHFANLNGVKYAYRLLGFNDEWRLLEGNAHTVTYTNLWEGDYTFQVKATNNDGVWNDNPTELSIKVLPPYWRHPLFYGVYILIIGLALLLFRRYSLIAVSEKNRLHIEHIERKNLIENTEAKMRFFTNISHEIRTPLTLISSPLEDVIANGKIDEQSRSSLQLVAKNVNRLLNLTNQLLQLRKIDKGMVEPQYSEVNAVRFLKEITGYFLQKALNKEINLIFHSEVNDEETIWIDKEMITTALYNVISNAYKFTPSKGQITIRLFKPQHETSPLSKLTRKKKDDKKQDWICFEVADTGPGIPSEELEHVFVRFYQSKQKLKIEHAGSGIGLSIVKEYIDLHRGKIETKSKIGEGTTIALYLPLGYEPAKNKIIANEPLPVNEKLKQIDNNLERKELEPQMAEDQKPIVLVVEDDKDLNEYLVLNLSDKYRVETAFDGLKGYDKAILTHPELIVSDVMMPHSDGIELCTRLKTNDDTKHIPIILLTAKAADESKIEGYMSGADAYVSKPFKLEVFKSQIEQLLKTRKILEDVFSKQVYLRPRDTKISTTDEKFLLRLNSVIDDHLAEADFDVTAMVSRMHMSHSTLLKKVKTLTGVPLVEFVKSHRLKRAAQILEKQSFQIAEVAYMVGFSDPKYFSKCFSKEFGKTPTEYLNEYIQNKEKNLNT
jgi:signal transduction histidine kinase/ligand-binding sensor domain-containing protein/DNA-binding response OmpR family regulator